MGAVQTKGLAFLLFSRMYPSMGRTSGATLTKVPRPIRLRGDFREPALDEVEPRGAVRNEVDVEPRWLFSHSRVVGCLCVP